MKVLVSVCNTGWIHKLTARSLLKLQQDGRHELTIIMPTWVPYEHGLNRVVADVLAGGFDYWLNIDADNPPRRNPLDLVDLDKDILGLPTPVWANMKAGDRPWYFNAMREVPGGWRPADPGSQILVKVDAVGSGCMLVARRVLEAAARPVFQRTYDADGRVVEGPDFRFCRQARAAGWQVWAHFAYTCMHFNEMELGEQIQAFHDMEVAR